MHKINYWLSVAVTLSWGYSLFAQDTALHLKTASKDSTQLTATHCTAHLPFRFSVSTAKGLVGNNRLVHDSDSKHTGMVWIKGGSFNMGASSDQGRTDEYPQHTVIINDFFMDASEVTNAQFTAFVQATGYITMAEKDVNWEEIKKQLPPGTPKPPDSVLKAASLIFVPNKNTVNLQDYSQWWEWKHGADWKHPQGPGSTIGGKENYPVVHISWDDAIAYCKWAGKRLPTEAEWEYAARGGVLNANYPWGNEFIDTGKVKCNSWQGVFPSINTVKDGFEGAAPVQSFEPNNFGLYDMAGNVWEWTADFYHHDYYRTFEKITVANSPKGPLNSYDPDEPWVPKRVIRGGSFLCNESYCSGYRVSARMKSSADSGMEHVGFRCVADN